MGEDVWVVVLLYIYCLPFDTLTHVLCCECNASNLRAIYWKLKVRTRGVATNASRRHAAHHARCRSSAAFCFSRFTVISHKARTAPRVWTSTLYTVLYGSYESKRRVLPFRYITIL